MSVITWETFERKKQKEKYVSTSFRLCQVQALTPFFVPLYISIHTGTYKSEENQLLLKVYQVKGPTEHYLSKFKNDNWAMDGYVRQTYTYIIILKPFKM